MVRPLNLFASGWLTFSAERLKLRFFLSLPMLTRTGLLLLPSGIFFPKDAGQAGAGVFSWRLVFVLNKL